MLAEAKAGAVTWVTRSVKERDPSSQARHPLSHSRLKVQIAQDEASGPGFSVGTYLGFLVPGVVTTPIDALSSPASMAARMRVQNAPSLSI